MPWRLSTRAHGLTSRCSCNSGWTQPPGAPRRPGSSAARRSIRSALASLRVDTNVLLYAYDPRDRAKQMRAQDCLQRLTLSHQGALSAQVLGEFFWVATRRLDPPLTAQEAERSLTNYARSWPVYGITSNEVLEAVRAVQRYQFAYWDALVWATAKLWEVRNVLTEDQPSSALLEGVRYVNPFEPDFDAETLK